jgi:hypothetical protein
MQSIDEAQALVQELVSSGIRRADIGFAPSGTQAIPSSAALNESEGGDSAASGTAAREILVTVAAADDAAAAKVAAILRRHGAIGMDQRAPERRKETSPSTAPARGRYKGPERRVSTTPWLGEERRRAA